jgi:hypothetical protein
MKFTEWLKNKVISETGRQRSTGGDLTNISLGKLGPYGQFGRDPGMPLPQKAVGHLVQAWGTGLRDKLSPVDSAPYIHGMDFSEFERAARVSHKLILQLPYVNGVDVLGLGNIGSPNAEASIDKVMRQIKNPESDPRIRDEGGPARVPGKFDLYDPDQNDENLANNDLALKFTIILQKILCYSGLMKRPDFVELQNSFNLKNPKIYSTNTVQEQNGYFVNSIFQYEKRKTSPYDYDFYSQEG